MAGPRDRARAAWDCGCRGGGPAGCRICPWRNLSRARRAREAKRDQYQVLEILGYDLRKAGGSRRAQANRQQCRALAAFQKHSFGGKNEALYVLDTFWSRLLVSRRHKPLLLHVNAERLPQPPMVTRGGSPSCARCSSAIAAIPADRRKPGGSPRSGLSGPVVRTVSELFAASLRQPQPLHEPVARSTIRV